MPRPAARRRSTALWLISILVASCATGGTGQRVSDYLDDRSGATITRVAEPVVFTSEDPARAAHAHDFLYAAPLAVNQSGRRAWWLWLGVWSGIDRAITSGDPEMPAVSGVALIVDGEPMELDFGGRVDQLAGVTRLPYRAPVASARVFLLPLTRSQVTRLGNARAIAVRTSVAEGPAVDWRPASGAVSPFGGLAAGDPSTTLPGG